MTDQPMDGFDARLTNLMTAYGDRAVTAYDAAAIASVATTRNPGVRLRLALAFGPRNRMAIAAALIALLALAAALIAGARHPSPIGDSFAWPTAAVWSPDGSNLAFLVDVADVASSPVAEIGRRSHSELWVVGADGGAPRHFATFDSMAPVEPPTWTPDGRSILVGVGATADGHGHSVIISVGLDGSAPLTLLDAGGDQIAMRGLSPKGDRTLYLRSDRTGTDLYLLDLARRLTTRLTTSGTVCCSGSWSPDGRWVMYTDGVVGGTQGPDAATRVVAADGSSEHRLGPCCDVGWSAEGPRAYFGSGGAGPLYSAAEDGTDVRVAYEGDAPYGWASSPDGSAFAAGTPQGIEVLHPGKAPMSLTNDPRDSEPAWSPDGGWIAFSGVRSGVAGVYVVPTSGGQPRLVASNTALSGPWRPGTGHAELTLIRDRAIITADPVGGPVRDLVNRATIAGDPVGPAGKAGSPSTIVIGPSGPDRDTYHIPVRGPLEVRFTNLSQVFWAPYGGLAEKSFYCAPSSCAVRPGGTLVVTPSGFGPGMVVEIWLAPYPASDYRVGFPVILDFEAAP